MASLMLLNLTAFSQTGTDKVCLTLDVAKKVALDLARCDSTTTELEITKEILESTKQIVQEKDNIIKTYKDKVDNFSKQVQAYKVKESEYQEIVTGLESDNKKLNRKLLFSKVSTGVVGAASIVVVLLLAL